MKDTNIVRNGAKIMSVRANAGFVREIAKEHGSFGKMLAKWPASNEIGLLELLHKRGSRLGGNTGQMLLRFLGWDGFCDIAGRRRLPARRRSRHRRDHHLETRPHKSAGAVQRLAEETGLPYIQISRICAMSIGENYSTETLARFVDGEE